MIPIKDIKPNVEIVDYYFLAFIVLMVISIIAVIIFLLKRKKTKKFNLLKDLDFNDAKKTAYDFTLLARNFVNENNQKEYEEIVKMLEKYKYKKEVPPLDNEVKEKIISFLKDIDV